MADFNYTTFKSSFEVDRTTSASYLIYDGQSNGTASFSILSDSSSLSNYAISSSNSDVSQFSLYSPSSITSSLSNRSVTALYSKKILGDDSFDKVMSKAWFAFNSDDLSIHVTSSNITSMSINRTLGFDTQDVFDIVLFGITSSSVPAVFCSTNMTASSQYSNGRTTLPGSISLTDYDISSNLELEIKLNRGSKSFPTYVSCLIFYWHVFIYSRRQFV